MRSVSRKRREAAIPGIPSPTGAFFLNLLPEQQLPQLSAKTTALLCCFIVPVDWQWDQQGTSMLGTPSCFLLSDACLLAGLIQKAQTHTKHVPRQSPSPQAHPCHLPPSPQAHPQRSLSIPAALQGTHNLFWLSRTPNNLADPAVPFTAHQLQGQAGALLLREPWKMCVNPAGQEEVISFPWTNSVHCRFHRSSNMKKSLVYLIRM